MKSGILSTFIVICGASAQAQDLTRHYLHQEQVGGVYTQDWSAVEIGRLYDRRFDVYVIGSGKLGDFFGVLGVDCDTPRFSQWRATGGYLTEDRVPIEVVRGVRNLVCDGPGS